MDPERKQIACENPRIIKMKSSANTEECCKRMSDCTTLECNNSKQKSED